MTDSVAIDLNVFDEDGEMVDTRKAELAPAQISDVIDHATQLVILQRAGKDIGEVLAELEEALLCAGLVADADGPRPG